MSSLKRDYVWNTIGVFLQNAISPLLLVVVARINGIYDTGLFSFAFALAIIFWAMGMWGGRTFQVSDAKSMFASQSYILVRLILLAVMLFGALVFVYVNQYEPIKSLLIIMLVAVKAVESVADAVHGVMQKNGGLNAVGVSLTLKASAGFLAFVAVDLITRNILLASVALLTTTLLITIFYDIPTVNKIETIGFLKKGKKKYFYEALSIMKLCLPLFAASFLAIFSLNIPRYFVDIYHPDDIGYFGILAMPVTLAVLFVTFILQPNVVPLTKLYNEGRYTELKSSLGKILRVSVLSGFVIWIIVALAGVQLLEFIFGLDFVEYRIDLLIIVAGAAINAIIGVYLVVLTVMRNLKAQFYTLAITNIVLAIVSPYTIEHYGLTAGVILFGLTSTTQVITLSILYSLSLRGKEND